MAYESILTTAIFARDIYSDNLDFPGWKRAVAPVAAPDGGFYGEAFTNGKDAVICAIRGTADLTDGLDDLSMFPHITGNQAEHAMQKLIIEYCRGFPKHYATKGGQIPILLTKKVAEIKANTRMSTWANKVPEDQAKFGIVLAQRAYQYCVENKQRIICFTGHSLGGALAQFLAEHTGEGGRIGIKPKVPAVAFNAPCMGSLGGMRRGYGGPILSVNSRLDPLSLATKLVGNATHSSEKFYVLVETKPPLPPPQVSDPPSIRQRTDFAEWFLGAALEYHGMANLVNALMSRYPGKELLSSFFPRG